jgi:hypothetical protein
VSTTAIGSPSSPMPSRVTVTCGPSELLSKPRTVVLPPAWKRNSNGTP